MTIVALDQLETLSKDELIAVMMDTNNTPDVRREARERWHELMRTMHRDRSDETVFITPTVPPPDED
jgi:hypothetical protein